MLKEFNIKHCN